MSDTTPSTATSFARLARHALAYGAAAGVLSALWIMIEFALGFHGAKIASGRYMDLAGILIPIGASIYGLMRWRDRVIAGPIRFSQAFGVGLGIGLVFATVFAGFTFLYVSSINPGLFEALINQYADALRQAGKAADEIQKATDTARASLTPATYAYAKFTQSLVSAFVIALTAAIVVRKRPL